MRSLENTKMYAEKISSLPPYLFAEIDERKREAERRGAEIIDLGIGDPDLPTPPHVVEAVCRAAKDPENHRYPSYDGMLAFREAVAAWYKRRKKVRLDLNAEDEVLTLIGSKEGLAHSALAFLNPGDLALVPDPAYPVYKNATVLAGGVPHSVPLLAESGFKPDLWGIDEAVARRAKVLFLNYPNNPTAATVERGFFKEVVDFASEHEILVLHDNPYSELTFDGYEAPSFLAAAGGGAKEVGVEFGSLSKTYNMTGWRIGFAVGNSEILRGLRLVKTNVDSGAFQAVQVAGITALTGSQECVKENVRVYRERREILVEGLRSAGLWEGKEVKKPKATFYLWVPVPSGYSSIQFSMFLLEQAGVVVTPGVGFGENGEGFVRFSLCTSAERLREACERLRGLKL